MGIFMLSSLLPAVVAADNRVEIRTSDGIASIVEALRSPDFDIRRSAAGTLINLSVNGWYAEKERKRYTRQTQRGHAFGHGELTSASFCFVSHCFALLALFFCHTERSVARNKVEIRSCGGIPLLLHSLELEDEETKRYAIRTLSNLMINGESRTFHALVALKRGRYFFPSLSYRLQNSRLLEMYHNADENKAELLRHKGIPTIVSCLRSSDVVTVRFATKTLSAFCAHDTFCEEIMRVSALPSILQGVNSQDVETVKESLASIPPLLRFEETVKTIIKMNYVNRIVRCVDSLSCDLIFQNCTRVAS